MTLRNMAGRWRLFILLAALLQSVVLAAATPLDVLDLEGRQSSSNTCAVPKLQPVIKSLVSQFPRSAVNSFCSSVVPPSLRPKTTVTKTHTFSTTETVTDTYTRTTTVCVTRIPKREPDATPAPAAALQANAHGGALGYPADLITKACQCVMPTGTKTVTAQETDYSFIFTETTNIGTVTATVTKALPTFRAQVDGPGVAIDKRWLQSAYTLNDKGNFVFNVLTAVKAKSLATTFSLTCEGFIVQTNTSSLQQERLLGNTVFTSGQAPAYFDPDRIVDDSEDGNGYPPLICHIDETNPARKLLKCRAVAPERNQWQYCPSYEQFFATGVLLTDVQGPECLLFDAVVQTV